MDLAGLQEQVADSPTIMRADQELAYMAALMQLPYKEIRAQREQVDDILDRLDVSHTGGAIFEVTADVLPAFVQFADWLVDLAQRLDDPALINLSNNFRIDPKLVF